MHVMKSCEEIIEYWVRQFSETMQDEEELRIGDASGDTPFGVKIIFDGYAENDDESFDYNSMSFAVFIHKDSLTKEFPPHDFTPWGLIHRSTEEVCIHVWHDCFEDSFNTDPLENYFCSTKLELDFVRKLIIDIWDRDRLSQMLDEIRDGTWVSPTDDSQRADLL